MNEFYCIYLTVYNLATRNRYWWNYNATSSYRKTTQTLWCSVLHLRKCSQIGPQWILIEYLWYRESYWEYSFQFHLKQMRQCTLTHFPYLIFHMLRLIDWFVIAQTALSHATWVKRPFIMACCGLPPTAASTGTLIQFFPSKLIPLTGWLATKRVAPASGLWSPVDSEEMLML